MRKLTTGGRGYYFWGGLIATALMIAFFAAGASVWGVVALVLAVVEFVIVAVRLRRGGP